MQQLRDTRWRWQMKEQIARPSSTDRTRGVGGEGGWTPDSLWNFQFDISLRRTCRWPCRRVWSGAEAWPGAAAAGHQAADEGAAHGVHHLRKLHLGPAGRDPDNAHQQGHCPSAGSASLASSPVIPRWRVRWDSKAIAKRWSRVGSQRYRQ